MLAEGEAGECLASGNNDYSYVAVIVDPNNPDLAGWCAAWCAQVQPDKVVGISTFDNGSEPQCRCYFSDDNKPSPSDDSILTLYEPDANAWINSCGGGTGCVAGADGPTTYTCYRNCAYNQCVSIYACLS